jgi:hypothetical protein
MTKTKKLMTLKEVKIWFEDYYYRHQDCGGCPCACGLCPLRLPKPLTMIGDSTWDGKHGHACIIAAFRSWYHTLYPTETMYFTERKVYFGVLYVLLNMTKRGYSDIAYLMDL